MSNKPELIKNIGDHASTGVVIASTPYIDMLPALAAGCSILWYLYRWRASCIAERKRKEEKEYYIQELSKRYDRPRSEFDDVPHGILEYQYRESNKGVKDD